LAAASLLLPASVVIAAPALKNGRPPALALSFERSFTPSQVDPRLAAALASRPALANDFGFTPAANKRRPNQVRVAIRAQLPNRALRATDLATLPVSQGTALTPASYNLGVAVGWRRFAVTGDVAKTESRNPALGAKESAVVGVSYSLPRFTGRVAVGAERDDNRAPALRDRSNYSLDVGAAYDVTQRIALTGGVRYNIERDRASAAQDIRRDSQAVYVGTAFKF